MGLGVGPCGHQEATCIIGGFWACPVSGCDGMTPKRPLWAEKATHSIVLFYLHMAVERFWDDEIDKSGRMEEVCAVERFKLPAGFSLSPNCTFPDSVVVDVVNLHTGRTDNFVVEAPDAFTHALHCDECDEIYSQMEKTP